MKRLFIFSGIASLFAFGLFTYIVKKDKLKILDFDTAVKIKDHIPPKFDQLFATAGDLGSVWIMSVILLIIIWKLPWTNKLLALVLFYAGQGLEYLLKVRLRQPGPSFQFQRHFTQTYFDKDYVQQGYSYPSGHSFRAIFVAMLIIYLAFRKFGVSVRSALISIAAVGFAFLIMLGKVVLGAHWITDIIGGVILGAALVFISLSFLPSSHRDGRTPNRARRSK